jgi:hypothetical protein
MEADVLKPKLLATTGTNFSCSITEFRQGAKGTEGKDNDVEPAIYIPDEEGDVTNYFKSIQWYILQSPPFLSSILTIVFPISISDLFPGRLTAPVSSQIALIIRFAPSSPRQTYSHHKLPLSPSRHTHLYPPLSQSTH